MSVWLVCPSARPVAEVNARMDKWRRMGYMVALWRDQIDGVVSDRKFWYNPCYPGFAVACNAMIHAILADDRDCDWIVCAGDDTDPDPAKRSDEIAVECSEHFRGAFGVMQPTGDRWGADEPWAQAAFPNASAYIDRICGSPWIGREFARRINGGRGPWWPEFRHMFVDEALQEAAMRLGVLWQRRDLIHYHDHCRRDGVARTPDFLTEAYGARHWQESKAVFERLKSDGFSEYLTLKESA